MRSGEADFRNEDDNNDIETEKNEMDSKNTEKEPLELTGRYTLRRNQVWILVFVIDVFPTTYL